MVNKKVWLGMVKQIIKYIIWIYYFPLKLWQLGWNVVWNMSEFTGIGLGRLAPWVFAQMIGAEKYKRIK